MSRAPRDNPVAESALPGKRRDALRTLAALGAMVTFAAEARGDDVGVPVDVQGRLLAKVSAYSKSVLARAGSLLRVLVVSKSGDPESERVAAQLVAVLGAMPTICNLAHKEQTGTFHDSASLAKVVVSQNQTILYLSSGFWEDDVTAIAKALVGVDVFTVAASARYVPQGMILGFGLSSGKPKLLCNLAQAKRQNVELTSDILQLMEVYR